MSLHYIADFLSTSLSIRIFVHSYFCLFICLALFYLSMTLLLLRVCPCIFRYFFLYKDFLLKLPSIETHNPQELEKNNGILRTTILETQAKLDICETKHGHAALRKKELREVQRKRDKLLREVAELRDELKE